MLNPLTNKRVTESKSATEFGNLLAYEWEAVSLGLTGNRPFDLLSLYAELAR